MKMIRFILCALLLSSLLSVPLVFSFTTKERQESIARRVQIGAPLSTVYSLFGEPDHMFTSRTSSGEYKCLRYDDNVTYVLIRARDGEIIEVESGLLQVNE